MDKGKILYNSFFCTIEGKATGCNYFPPQYAMIGLGLQTVCFVEGCDEPGDGPPYSYKICNILETYLSPCAVVFVNCFLTRDTIIFIFVSRVWIPPPPPHFLRQAPSFLHFTLLSLSDGKKRFFYPEKMPPKILVMYVAPHHLFLVVISEPLYVC